MRITGVRTRNYRFSEPPISLKRHLVTNTSIFEDFQTKPGGWFGPVVFTMVEVEASDGTVGIGTCGGFQGGARELIEMYYKDLVLDEDPRRHEYLWQRMYRTTVRFGRSGVAMSAIAGIDIACWDLHARAENRPLYELIGGLSQSSVPCYASRLYALEDLDELADEARTLKQLGFKVMKQRFGFGPADGPAGMRRNTDLVRIVRDAVGDDIELAADAYMGWDTGYTIEMTKLLREYRLSWIEEPLMPHDLAGYHELKRRCPWQRWSCGEHSYSKWEFQQLIDARIDILQPDANRAGGITEMLKICVMAEAAGLPVVPHSNEAHNLHVVFSRPPHVCPMVEYFPDHRPDTGNELFWAAFDGNSEAQAGMLLAPKGTGLGITAREHPANVLAEA